MDRFLKDADILFVHGKQSLFSKAIKWATRRRNEKPTIATHVAMIVFYGKEPYVIEAVWSVTTTPYKKWKREHDNFSVWRHKHLTDEERQKIANNALEYKNNFYGVLKIGLHLADCLLSKISGKDWFVFRRLQLLDSYPICNWLVAYSYYDVVKYSFGRNPKFTDPDSINDYVRKSEDVKLMYIKSV